MALYSESVELWPEGRRSLILTLVFAVVLLLVAFGPRDFTLEGLWRLLASYFHLLAGLAGIVVLAFSNSLEIELTERELLLRVGPQRKRFALADVTAARPIPVAGPEEKPQFWVGFLPSFVSSVVPSQVEVKLAGGETFRFSSRHPGHLAEMIQRGAEHRQRELAVAAGPGGR